MGKGKAKAVNIEIAPHNEARMKAHLEAYNADPNRTRSALKYTDVVNDALDAFLSQWEKKRSNSA